MGGGESATRRGGSETVTAVLGLVLAMALVSGPAMTAVVRRAWRRHEYLSDRRLLRRVTDRY